MIKKHPPTGLVYPLHWFDFEHPRVGGFYPLHCFFNEHPPPTGLDFNSHPVHDTALFNYFHQASKEKVLIMGDFNFAGIDWNKPELDDSDYFMKCVNDHF